jgi:hypothetical protein
MPLVIPFGLNNPQNALCMCICHMFTKGATLLCQQESIMMWQRGHITLNKLAPMINMHLYPKHKCFSNVQLKHVNKIWVA